MQALVFIKKVLVAFVVVATVLVIIVGMLWSGLRTIVIMMKVMKRPTVSWKLYYREPNMMKRNAMEAPAHFPVTMLELAMLEFTLDEMQVVKIALSLTEWLYSKLMVAMMELVMVLLQEQEKGRFVHVD